MIQAGGGWSSYIHADEESGECLSTSIVCGDFGMPLYSENLVIRHNVIYSEYARSLLYGGNVGYAPPRFENNRLYLPFGENENGHRVVIALWANDEMQTDGNDFLWIHTDHIWPSNVWMESGEQFLNEYLGSGNTVEYTK